MHKLVKEIVVTTTLLGAGIVGLNQQSLTAQAAVKTHKLTSLPKKFRGTWYTNYKGKTSKFKVSAKRFGRSKYRAKRDPNSYVAVSELTFTPFQVKGAHANTLYLMHGEGSELLRQTTIKHQKALISYNQEEHYSEFTIFTKSKKSSVQKFWSDSNPYGNIPYTVKYAKKQRSSYNKINKSIKKYFGKAVTKHVVRGGKQVHHVKITYYSPVKRIWNSK
ncbi:hypothetical protein D1831_07665 [Lactiplantibacillus garii]|uniref:Uncharacterized protein n=1 Tax=Lactiplantibacillus garii TaxID=2306423 RepID=A0A426D759_9LACO|nr:hypothetical protein [Lactiplantibacillus garii]RRK10427.1 hypothetical protein D1831_07665 [Lactiplantibacillus garii]